LEAAVIGVESNSQGTLSFLDFLGGRQAKRLGNRSSAARSMLMASSRVMSGLMTKLTCPAEETDSTKKPARQHRVRLSALLSHHLRDSCG
jgi:hypothetical protein